MDLKKPNHLIHEKSPYLLQHAYNPVNWHPWSDKAFNRACKENKPIFLSIGYSTCHWCHVMAHESFEDPCVAQLMNEVFISIKVDREERPDIDNLYMNVCQILTGSGGWPLTIIMTPDKKPFFAGTYIPKEKAFGRFGMVDLIPYVKEVWINRQVDIANTTHTIMNALYSMSHESGDRAIHETILDDAYEQLCQIFDKTYGGFSHAPKFPNPSYLLFLLHFWHRSKNDEALHMVERTLWALSNGGIYDHIGFGFHRYAVDRTWLVPHFEKMLYDQALLSCVYCEAYKATGKSGYKNMMEEIFSYILRDMLSPEGGFYSSEDADSEGEEGKFYLWGYEQIASAFEKEDAEYLISLFNIKEEGNYSNESTRQVTGKNILYCSAPFSETSDHTFFYHDKQFHRLRERLFALREKRVHPYKDDKILTDWNGLMIAALAKGSTITNNADYLKTARMGAEFILKEMLQDDGSLLHRYRQKETAIPGFLPDYAFLIWGLLELYEACFEIKYLKTAIALNTYLMGHFWDKENGGFYLTADNTETIIIRQKHTSDGAIPSGNSIALWNLLRLSHITTTSELGAKAQSLINSFSLKIKDYPLAYTHLLTGLDFFFGPTYELIIVGDHLSDEIPPILKELNKHFLPNTTIIFRQTDKESSELTSIAPFTKDMKTINNKVTFYLCKDFKCLLPTNDIHEIMNMLTA